MSCLNQSAADHDDFLDREHEREVLLAAMSEFLAERKEMKKDAALGAFVRELLHVVIRDSPQRETDRIRAFIAAQEQP